MERHTQTGQPAPTKPVSQTVKEHVPGTHEYQATHGATGAHQTVEQAKAHIPGTEEHRMHEAGVTHPGHAGPTVTEQVKTHVPGTGEYQAAHGATGAHQTVAQAKAHVPGTEEHRLREGMHPGTTAMGTTGATTTAAGTLPGATAAGHQEHKGLVGQLKEHLPGTREHEAKKMSEGRM